MRTGGVCLENRLAKAKDLLRREGLDGLLVQSPANRRYLSGFTGTAGSLLITEGESIILTDFRYTRQAKEQCPVHGYRAKGCMGSPAVSERA